MNLNTHLNPQITLSIPPFLCGNTFNVLTSINPYHLKRTICPYQVVYLKK
uniref:Uncharacterized protein n=1 Tax=Anguilla anguilla TaxID=7936 RepID=A0A0E9V9Y4_ANGAN